MTSRRHGLHHRVRALGISLLILGLAHAPMPQADYHNVRHHDDPGQVCELHDHLLRWHPDAGRADDVAILHWHWLLPTSGPGESRGLGEEAPKIHAHVDDWQGLTVDDGEPFLADAGSRPLVTPPAASASPFEVAALTVLPGPGGPRAGPMPVHAFSATFTPRASMSSWLVRWSC